MKKIIASFVLCSVIGVSSVASDYSVTEGNWQISYTESDNRLDIIYNGEAVFNEAYAEVVANVMGSATDVTLSSRELTPTITKIDVEDCFGSGRSHIFTYVKDGMVMKHRLNFYDNHPYLIALVTVESESGAVVQSRRMMPMAIAAPSQPLEGASNRMLWVPFDNDGHLRYKNIQLKNNTENVSHEVSAVFDGESRYGLVAGSVDHDSWKSGVTIAGENGYKITKFELLSGLTNEYTRDVLPHGKVKGEIVSSARFMVGLFDDWREGLDTFAEANNMVAPRAEWTKGNPIGWSSWGVMQNYINYDGVIETAAFIKEQLYDLGFHNNAGQTVISLDSFAGDNISKANLYKMGTKLFCDGEYKELGTTKQGSNQIMGLYGGPFVAWSWVLDSKIEGTGVGSAPSYTWRDASLKVNGEVYTVPSNSGNAVDPTHPAIQALMENFMKQWASWGCKYIKIDFLNNGIIEGDSWYNPDITTGVQAYNYGMKLLYELVKKYDMYIVESIAPLFPYQYAHGRRTCCDRFSEIGESEYVMNSISYGWWTDKLYTVNDPDQLVMCKAGHGAKETIGENRARATTGMATGAFIFGDNFSDKVLEDGVVRGYPEESRTRALQIMGNVDINDYVRNNTGSFRPVEGHKPSTSQQSETLFVRETPQYYYLAVFNWGPLLSNVGTVKYERLGIDPSVVGEVKELWLNEAVTYDAEGISYKVPAKDARVYRITRNDYSGEEETTDDVIKSSRQVSVSLVEGLCYVKSDCPIESIEVYNISGQIIAKSSIIGQNVVTLKVPQYVGVYIVKCQLATGDIITKKCVNR